MRNLDKHASEFNFPVLDNAYVQMAAARMTAFRSVQNWLVAFEVLGFSERQGIFADDLYAFGSCLEREGFISSTSVMIPLPDHPLIDPYTEAWIADWQHWFIDVRGETYEFAPSRNEYISQGIDVPIEGGPGSLSEEKIMHFFIHKEGAHKLFMRDFELREELRLDSEMSIFVQTEQWQHPDVAGEEKPSNNIAIRSLLVALASNSPADFQRGNPNTDWHHWVSVNGHD